MLGEAAIEQLWRVAAVEGRRGNLHLPTVGLFRERKVPQPHAPLPWLRLLGPQIYVASATRPASHWMRLYCFYSKKAELLDLEFGRI